MNDIDLSPAEYERLQKLAADEKNPDLQFLAMLLLRLIVAVEQEAEYQREQREYE